MSEQNLRPDLFPVRKVSDQDWEVLIASENNWLPCQSEDDARVIASGGQLEYDALECTRRGREFADQLQKLADTLEKYHVGVGARFFARRAGEARNP